MVATTKFFHERSPHSVMVDYKHAGQQNDKLHQKLITAPVIYQHLHESTNYAAK